MQKPGLASVWILTGERPESDAVVDHLMAWVRTYIQICTGLEPRDNEIKTGRLLVGGGPSRFVVARRCPWFELTAGLQLRMPSMRLEIPASRRLYYGNDLALAEILAGAYSLDEALEEGEFVEFGTQARRPV